AAVAADAKERDKEPGAVWADDRDALALGNAHLVERRCLRPRQLADPSIGEFAEAASGRIRLVNDADFGTIDIFCPKQEVADVHRDLHHGLLSVGPDLNRREIARLPPEELAHRRARADIAGELRVG